MTGSDRKRTEGYYRGWGVQAEGDTPVPGDYDGDSKSDIAVYRPTTGTWFILKSSAGDLDWLWHGWGVATDQPMPADYDGDGKTDVAVYRPSTAEWFVKPSNDTTPWKVVFGATGDVPLLRAPVPPPLPAGHLEQTSYAGECGSKPPGSVCVGYSDGYTWLAYDWISGGVKTKAGTVTASRSRRAAQPTAATFSTRSL